MSPVGRSRNRDGLGLPGPVTYQACHVRLELRAPQTPRPAHRQRRGLEVVQTVRHTTSVPRTATHVQRERGPTGVHNGRAPHRGGCFMEEVSDLPRPRLSLGTMPAAVTPRSGSYPPQDGLDQTPRVAERERQPGDHDPPSVLHG
jgi:hypothetical protein